MRRGKFIYCDPFSQDLDCGDESWYLKRMKDREHLRKYRTSSKTDWMFNRAKKYVHQKNIFKKEKCLKTALTFYGF
jgi:hypothetical protein